MHLLYLQLQILPLLAAFYTFLSFQIPAKASLLEKSYCNVTQCQSIAGHCFLINDCYLKRVDHGSNALIYCKHSVRNIHLANQGISYLCPHALSPTSPLTIDLSDNLISHIPEEFFSRLELLLMNFQRFFQSRSSKS